MKTFCATLATAGLCLSLSVQTAAALSDEQQAAIAAAAIIGIAAVAHNQNHYQDGYKPKNADETAAFERGYRDGLHNEPYDSRHGSSAYAQGYDAGHKERSNRLAYKTSNVAGTKVPDAALNSCIKDAASAMGVGTHDVHAIKAGQEGADNFYIELASGHKHLVCATNSKGQIFDTRYGKL